MSRSRKGPSLNRPPPGEPFVCLTRNLLRSPAFRAMSGAACSVLFRVMIEHLNHAGTDNGRLRVTQRQFAEYGIRKQTIPDAIAEAEALGFIERVDRGRRSYGSFPGRAAVFRLTMLGIADGTDICDATNEWKRLPDMAAAIAAVQNVRQQLAVERRLRAERLKSSVLAAPPLRCG
jgi:hypothetical protein